MLPDEVGSGEALLEVLDHGVFISAAAAGASPDLFPGCVEELVNAFLRDVVGGELGISEGLPRSG